MRLGSWTPKGQGFLGNARSFSFLKKRKPWKRKKLFSLKKRKNLGKERMKRKAGDSTKSKPVLTLSATAIGERETR